MSAWAILTGVLRIAAAIRLRKEIQGEWLLILNGALSVVLGILLLVLPSAGLVTLVWLLGVYAIVFGGHARGARVQAPAAPPRPRRRAPDRRRTLSGTAGRGRLPARAVAVVGILMA